MAALRRDQRAAPHLLCLPGEALEASADNVIESPFATVRLRQRVTKGAELRTKGLLLRPSDPHHLTISRREGCRPRQATTRRPSAAATVVLFLSQRPRMGWRTRRRGRNRGSGRQLRASSDHRRLRRGVEFQAVGMTPTDFGTTDAGRQRVARRSAAPRRPRTAPACPCTLQGSAPSP